MTAGWSRAPAPGGGSRTSCAGTRTSPRPAATPAGGTRPRSVVGRVRRRGRAGRLDVHGPAAGAVGGDRGGPARAGAGGHRACACSRGCGSSACCGRPVGARRWAACAGWRTRWSRCNARPRSWRRRNRTWLRTRSATYPMAPQLAGWRHRAVAPCHRPPVPARSPTLSRVVPVDLAGIVRPPARRVRRRRARAEPARAAGPMDDDAWEAAVADLSRAAESDGPRRRRWLFALAACAELRDDPPARESAGRWALDAAALPARARGDRRADPLPDTVAIEPSRPETWEGAVAAGPRGRRRPAAARRGHASLGVRAGRQRQRARPGGRRGG